MTSLIDRFMNQLTAEEKSPETLSHYGGKKTGQESGKEESESTEAVAVNA